MGKSKNAGTQNGGQRNALAIYRRILRIDELISKGLYPSIYDLMEDHNVEASRATIFRTLEFMRDQLFAPIAFDKDKNGYYYTERTYRLPAVWTSEQEIYAVATLKNMIASLEGTPLYESAKQILEMIKNSPVKNPVSSFEIGMTNSKDNIDSDWISKRYIFLDQHHSQVEKDVWDKISNAMKNSNVIEFDYVREYDGKKGRRKVKPYQVLKSRETWTLWCFDINRDDYRLFTLNRISNAKVSSEKFTLPNDFEYEKHSQKKDSVWYSAEERKFKIWISDWAMDANRNYVWGRNQKVKKYKDDGYEISFYTSNEDWVLEKLLSLADGGAPIEPKKFSDLYYEYVGLMSVRLEKDG